MSKADGQVDAALARYIERHPPRLAAVWQHRAPDVCPYHSHSTFEAVNHFQGRGVTDARGGGRVDFDVGWTVLYPPGMAHNQVMLRPGLDVCVHWTLDAPLPAALRRCVAVPPDDDGDIERACLALAQAEHQARGLRRVELQHRAVALFARLIRDAVAHARRQQIDPAPADHAERAYRYVAARFRDADRIDTVAQHVGVSPDYLRHVFKARYGVSLKQAISRARIEHAKRLLAYSPLPQKAIALECGFANDRHLSATFRAAVGLTPGAYRHRHTPSPTSPPHPPRST